MALLIDADDQMRYARPRQLSIDALLNPAPSSSRQPLDELYRVCSSQTQASIPRSTSLPIQPSVSPLSVSTVFSPRIPSQHSVSEPEIGALHDSSRSSDMTVSPILPTPPPSDSIICSPRSSTTGDAQKSITQILAEAAARVRKRKSHSAVDRQAARKKGAHRHFVAPEHVKMRKEKRSRKEQQRSLQHSEDALQYIAGVDRSMCKGQTSGNGAVSGLSFSKIETMDGFIAVAVTRLQMMREDCLAEGRLAEFEAENNRIFHDALASGLPLAETSLMNHGDAPCDHRGRLRKCYVHDHPDWTECRKQRAAASVRARDREVQRLCREGQ